MLPMLAIGTKSPACLKRGAPALETARPEAFARFGRLGDMGLNPESEPQKRTTRGSEELAIYLRNLTRRLFGRSTYNSLSFPLVLPAPLYSTPPTNPRLVHWNGGHSPLLWCVHNTCDISPFSEFHQFPPADHNRHNTR